MLKYIYLGIIALLMVLIVRNMFREKKICFKIDCVLVMVPLILRLFLIK